MNERCIHKAEALFKEPSRTDAGARMSYMLGKKGRWVRCSNCGVTGYHGRRRINWRYGGADILERAREWNASLTARAAKETEEVK